MKTDIFGRPMIRVLCYPRCHSAVRLRYPTYGDVRPLNQDLHDGDTLFRWGNSHPISVEFVTTINDAGAIKTCVNKMESLRLMRSAVRIPTMYEQAVPLEAPTVVIRSNNHMAGSGFRISAAGRQEAVYLNPDEYALDYLTDTKEFRVWFFGEQMICGERRPRNGVIEDLSCRSEWGYFFRPLPRNLGTKVQSARQSIGIYTGAADILYSNQDNRYYFLEINSAPSLDHSYIINFFKTNLLPYEH